MSVKIKLELTDRQYQQLIVSLENDWIDNDKHTQIVIDNILQKIRRAILKGVV